MRVKFKRLCPEAVLPTYAKPGDAGLDLVAIDNGTYETKEVIDDIVTRRAVYLAYKTGLAVEIPEGYVGLIFPRSSISNVSLSLANAVGVIDSGYRGELGFRFRVLNDYPIKYKAGDKIGQLVIMPYPQIQVIESSDLSDSERGEGGFGSSDREGCTCAEWTGAKCGYCVKVLGI